MQHKQVREKLRWYAQYRSIFAPFCTIAGVSAEHAQSSRVRSFTNWKKDLNAKNICPRTEERTLHDN